MLLTTDRMPGGKYKLIGLVVGRYPAITDGFEKARGKMIEEAEKLGADAIIDVHFASSASEVICYGTAVKTCQSPWWTPTIMRKAHKMV